MEEFLKSTIKEAGYLAKGYYLDGVSYSAKSSPGDIVTVADGETEKFVVEKIRAKYPDHGIIGEESVGNVNPDAEYVWVIDPIDGTRNFANHIALWCTMIGIEKDGKPYMGAVYDAINDELFFAEVGKGAYLNDKKIEVSDHHEVEHSFICYSAGEVNDYSPYSSNKENYEKYVRFYNNLMGETGHWVSNYGTMLLTCQLAAGRIDALLHNAGLYHDYLAPYVIATEAGALFTNSSGENWQKRGMDIVVANPELHAKLLKLFE